MSTGVTVAGGAERFVSIGGTITALALMVSTRTSWQYWQSPPSRQLSTPSPHAEPNRDLSSTSTAREAPRAEERRFPHSWARALAAVIRASHSRKLRHAALSMDSLDAGC